MTSEKKTYDVVIVGAGVMGCASALALVKRGLSVCVLERSVPGAEASSAAAGMLAAQVEAHHPGPFFDLCIQSRARFALWAEDLRARTGIDVEHRVCGVLKLTFDEAAAATARAHASWQRAAGQRVDLVDRATAREIEPTIAEGATFAAHFPDEARIDPPRLLKALRIAAERAGTVFKSGALVRRVVTDGDRASGVEIEGGQTISGAHVVVAAGSWSNLVPGVPLAPSALRPARGQIVELSVPVPILRGIVNTERIYLSPRDDGRVLVGSTLEFVGFERAVTAKAVRDLLDGAIAAAPALERAELVRCWSAFRPFTPDERPLLGPTAIERLWLATGHFRNGILLSPLTAEIVAACVLGERPPVDLAPFGSDRPATSRSSP